ncbi:DUF1801 domain-containing protein [Ulvibacterium marinum]|uniref:DUF1801 domain-containing protein n=1 Tax=Ulvibacterium marinum TaxID=2419782 RepID=UPI0024952DD6|nr:DUF1801 domain-containing protein [Ulvibacterium marinum]
MNQDIEAFNENQVPREQEICTKLALLINKFLPDAENRMWHGHPVWFFEGNPIVGYSKLKAGIRLMFWSGASFEEKELKPGTGKFKDASILYSSSDQIIEEDIKRWLEKARKIQWDYKNIYKRKGVLERLK